MPGFCQRTVSSDSSILLNKHFLSPNQGAWCGVRIYKQATIHIYFVALGYVCFESLMGGVPFEGVSIGIRNSPVKIGRGLEEL